MVGRAENTERDREVEAAPLLLPLGGREVRDDTAQRELEARVADRRAHALARFRDRGVGETHDVEMRQTIGDVDLDDDRRGLETPQRARRDPRDARADGRVDGHAV